MLLISFRTEVVPLNEPVSAGGGTAEGQDAMADRRAGRKQGPYVPSPGGGIQPRDRNKDGTWRKKRSDAKPKKG